MKRSVSIICSLAMVLQLLLGAVPVWAAEDTEGTSYEAPESPAVTYNMNVDWRFKKASDSATYPLAKAAASVVKNGKNFYDVDYDDSDWETVSVPHPINAEDSFDGNCYDAGESGLYRGFMFYRKHITVPASDVGKKMFLEFEAVRQSVYLYVNGEMVGYYEAGITAMGFDITNYIKAGEDNVIAVATDNASDRGQSDTTKVTHETRPGSEPGAADGDGYQWNTKDFNEVQGGITGNVNLYVKGSIYQTLPLYNNLKTTGNYIYASDFDIREGKATITVEGEIRNESGEDKNVSLEVAVVDFDGNVAAQFSSQTENAAAAKDKGVVYKSVIPDDAYGYREPTPVPTAAPEAEITPIPSAAPIPEPEGTLAPTEEPGAETLSLLEASEDIDGDISLYEETAATDEPELTATPTIAPTNADTVDVTKITASAAAENLKFWSPDSPNLYDVYTILKDGDGNVLDVQKTTTGFRKVEYDITDGGLKINDNPVWLTGYAQRSTNEWAVIGVANDWLTDLDMQWVKESNSNFIRWMHVAPKPNAIRSGDKYGVVSVCPAGDKEADVDGRAWDQRVEAMRDAMIYFRNSPSVLFWETGNNAITAEHQQEMTDMKNLIDPNGGRFSGCRTISSADQIKAAEYVGTMLNRNALAAKNSMKSADKYMPIVETEYAREEAPRRVWDDFSPPDYDYDNMWLGSGASKQDGYDVHDLTSEGLAVSNMAGYQEFYNDRVGGSSGNDYYSAAAIMVWSDSNMHNRNTASENCRTSGKVDAVRIKKEAFYAMKAAQSSEPEIHILGHWNYPQLSDDTYNYPEKTFNGTYWEKTGNMLKRDPKNKTVYVIGSAGISKMELYINDTLAGACTKPTNTFVYSFPNIDVTQSGEVKAVAYDAREQVIAEDSIKTVGDPVTLTLTPVAGPDGLIADGSDIAYFDVAVVDKDGNTYPLSYDKITMSLSGEGVLLGGYNSGVGDKITTNNTDFCYAECGTNRIFVRSTRKAGDITLSAALEGQAPVSATIKSADDLELADGLTTKAQRSFKQGEIVQPIPQEVPALKALSSTFTADFTEGTGNTEIVTETEKPVEEYTVKVNGTAVSGYVNIPQLASNTSSLVCDVVKTLDALKAEGADITYEVISDGSLPSGYDGHLPMVSITGGLNGAYTGDDGLFKDLSRVDAVAGSTTLYINSGEGKNLLNAEVESKGNEIVADIAAVLGYLNGVSYQLDTENKTANITYTAPTSQLNGINLLADGNTEQETEGKCVRVTAVYDNGALKSVTTETVDISEAEEPSLDGNTKVMYWESLKSMKPVEIPAEPTPTPVPWSAYDITPYDELIDENKCEETSISGITVEAGAPDGSKYFTTEAGACLQSEFGYGSNTKEDIMIAFDVKFNAEGAGVTPNDQGDKKVAGTLTLRNGMLQVQRGSSDYTNSKIAADTNTWYHIAFAGRYSAPDANADMYVWKYNGSEKEYLGKMASVPLRNLSASNNNGVSHLNLSANTSVDNLQIYKLGADQLWLDSTGNTVKAGESMLFTYSATRANEYITNPAVTWSVYNEANDALLEDSEITISESGLLTVSGNAQAKVINVRVTADAGTDKEIYASKTINISAVDKSTDTYDEITLSAEGEKTTVRVGEPVKLKAETKLNGNTVTPGEGDLIYLICNEANLRELGNKNITITADGTLSVTEDALPQKITVRATNKSGSVSGTYSVEVLPANMNYGNEDKYSDTFASANACEDYISGPALAEGSWDGSGYYQITSAYDFEGFSANTNADVIYSADMRFANDGAGWTIYSADKGKLGLQLSSSGTSLNALGAGNKTVGTMSIDKNAWYNIQIMCAAGNSGNSYAVCMVYKYDENGKRVNPNTGAENSPYLLTCALRNLSESTANHINISAGTYVDNVMNMYVAPDALKLSVDAKEVLAGGTAQASATASRKGIDFPYLNSSLIKYEIYDAENKYPLGDSKIAIDAAGKISVDAMADPQEVYVRVSSVSGGMYDSAKLTIKSSDIFEVTSMGFNEDYSILKRLKVTKNFYYTDDVTFITAAYDENGAMTAIMTKKMYGDALNLGEDNYVQMNMTMPVGFDKVNDRLNAFVITKLSTSNKTEGADLTVYGSSDMKNTEISNIPDFDAEAKVTVLVLKTGFDEENVKDEAILYFNQISGKDIMENKLHLPVDYSEGLTVKLSGTVNGVHTIAAHIPPAPPAE